LAAAITVASLGCAIAHAQLAIVVTPKGIDAYRDAIAWESFCDRVTDMTAPIPPSAPQLDEAAASLTEASTQPGLSAEQYKRKMERRKAVQQQRLAERTHEKGLVIVHTGDGKGKTTAALGMVLRSLGHGYKVAIIQFIKGAWEPAEKAVFATWADQLDFHALGEGFTWETQDRDRDIAKATAAWHTALTYIRNSAYRTILLDEINIALKHGFLSVEQVLAGIAEKAPDTHIILTGRGAPLALIEQADLVTEMKLIKHPFREQGVKAQPGIEF
jgi:cob(I)alamin adenosyltransferase